MASRASQALLWQYSSDCTPLSTTERVTSQAMDVHVRRAARSAADFLIERCFVSDSTGATAVVLDAPAEIQDKGAMCHWQACRAFCKTPREVGHRALSVVHHVYDRALMVPLSRLHYQSLHMVYDEMSERHGEGQAYLDWLTTWFSCCGCSCHDIHLGLRWGIMNFVAQPTLMRSAFICMESLRNGYSVLLRHIGSWLSQVVRFCDWDAAEAAAVYRLLGVTDEDWLGLMTLLQPRWHDGALLVASAVGHRNDLPALLTTVLLKAWTFDKWSDSRWLGLCRSTKTLCLSLLLGIEHCVQFCVRQPHTSAYYISGFEKHCSPQVRLMAGVVAISGGPADEALQVVLADSRTPLLVAELEQELHEGVLAVCSLPAAVWRVMAGVCECTPAVLRTAALSATLTSMSFVLGKLRAARRPPYDLLTGDRRANIRRLAASENPPSNDISWKVWKLMRLDFNEDLILEGLGLLARASWTTTVTEQGHASSSILMRMHKRYGKLMMQDRALLVSASALFRPTDEERLLARAQTALGRCARRVPNRITGRQVLLRDLHSTARAMMFEGCSSALASRPT